MNSFFSDAMMSAIFLPIALRNFSALAAEKPDIVIAMRMTCSWYTIAPYVSSRIGRSRSS